MTCWVSITKRIGKCAGFGRVGTIPQLCWGIFPIVRKNTGACCDTDRANFL
jgi:hypothetical protein